MVKAVAKHIQLIHRRKGATFNGSLCAKNFANQQLLQGLTCLIKYRRQTTKFPFYGFPFSSLETQYDHYKVEPSNDKNNLFSVTLDRALEVFVTQAKKKNRKLRNFFFVNSFAVKGKCCNPMEWHKRNSNNNYSHYSTTKTTTTGP